MNDNIIHSSCIIIHIKYYILYVSLYFHLTAVGAGVVCTWRGRHLYSGPSVFPYKAWFLEAHKRFMLIINLSLVIISHHIMMLLTVTVLQVEDMRTEDFVSSADASSLLRLDPSTVVRIESANESTSVLTLSYGPDRSQVIRCPPSFDMQSQLNSRKFK